MKNIYSFSGPEGLKDIKHPIVFIHGTGMDHTVWTLPIRYFLRKDRNVLGIDLPGHGRSKGKLLETIPEMAKWLISYLDDLARSISGSRATVGMVEVSPNSRNTIPGHVFFTMDIRHPEDKVIADMTSEIDALSISL